MDILEASYTLWNSEPSDWHGPQLKSVLLAIIKELEDLREDLSRK